MNIQTYKKNTRFSIVKLISKNSVLNLFSVYKNIENSRLHSSVKTKQDFVSFTPIFYLSCYKKTKFHFHLLTSFQIFRKNLQLSKGLSTGNYGLQFFDIQKSHVSFSNVSEKKKRKYINNNFYFVKDSRDIFFQENSNVFVKKANYFNIISFFPSFNNCVTSGKQNFFNAFSIRLKFHYIYILYTLKKNTREGFTVDQIPFFYKNIFGNSFFIKKQIWTIQPKKTVKNEGLFSNSYVPRKKRKRIVKRKRWKLKTNYPFFYNKVKALRSKIIYKNKVKSVIKHKPIFNKFLFKKFSNLNVDNPIKRNQINSYKYKFNLSRLLHYYIFGKSIKGSKKKINFSKAFQKTYLAKKNKYFVYSFYSTYSPKEKKQKKRKSRVSKKKNFLISVFKKEERKYTRMNKNKIKKKGYTHKKGFLQLLENDSTRLNQVPSTKYLNIKNFIHRTFGAKTSLFRINAYSFTRYSFNNAIKEKKFELDKKLKKIKVHKDRSWEAYSELLIHKKAKEALWLKISKNSSKKIKTNRLDSSKKSDNLDKYAKKKFTMKKKFKKKKNSNIFRQFLEKERRRRYRYIAIYIKDLLRLSFVGFYYKHAQLRREFSAFILKKLPRNRKETKFIRFLIKIRKVFAAQREEVIGIRLRFQGRINRWRRTKHVVGKKGVLPLQTFSTTIAYGSAQGMNRKGAFGRRLWIAYNSAFANGYQINFYSYRNSKQLLILLYILV